MSDTRQQAYAYLDRLLGEQLAARIVYGRSKPLLAVAGCSRVPIRIGPSFWIKNDNSLLLDMGTN